MRVRRVPLKFRNTGTVFALAVLTGSAALGAITNTTYTGGGGSPTDWNDAGNWSAGVPNNAYHAFVTNAVAFSTGPAGGTVARLTTGPGAVSMTGGLQLASADFSASTLDVGTGGVTFGGGLAWPWGNSTLIASGNVVAASIAWGNVASIIQKGGQFQIGAFNLPINMIPFVITNWSFTNGTPTTIAGCADNGSFRLDGTPIFAGGQRPNWSIGSYSAVGVGKWDLNGQTLKGNIAAVNGAGSPISRYAWLASTNGGTIDINVLAIGNSGYLSSYLDLHGVTVLFHGTNSTLVYDNRSLNAAGTNLVYSGGASTSIISKAYCASDNTTFMFVPTGVSTQLVNTGSKDRNSFLLNPADWTNNFALDVIKIGTNTTVKLTGVANIEAGGTNALYATSIDGLGPGAVIALNGHNVYLKKRANNITVDRTGGGRLYQAQAGTIILIQ